LGVDNLLKNTLPLAEAVNNLQECKQQLQHFKYLRMSTFPPIFHLTEIQYSALSPSPQEAAFTSQPSPLDNSKSTATDDPINLRMQPSSAPSSFYEPSKPIVPCLRYVEYSHSWHQGLH